jgi:hypothetical protein
MLARGAARRGAAAAFSGPSRCSDAIGFSAFCLTLCNQRHLRVFSWQITAELTAEKQRDISGGTAGHQRQKKQHISAHDAISLNGKSNMFRP